MTDYTGRTDAELRLAALSLSSSEAATRWERGRVLAAARLLSDELCAEIMDEVADTFGLSYSHLTAERWLAECYTRDEQVPGLSWTHHRLAATLLEPRRGELLLFARNTGMGTRAFEELLRGADDAAAAECPFADPIALDLHAYTARRVAELCDDVPARHRERVMRATIQAGDEWTDAQMREGETLWRVA